jgi:hypothetical protein
MESLSIIEIEKQVVDGIANPNLKDVISILLSACNDWPHPLDTMEEFEQSVSDFIHGGVTHKAILVARAKIDHLENPWEAESLSILSDVFEFYDSGDSLGDILSDLREKLE